MIRAIRLAYLVSHPIQYQAPLLRHIAADPDIDLTVLFGSDFSVRGYKDVGFGVGVEWDVPLTEGYRHEFLPVVRDSGNVSFSRPLNRGIWSRLRGRGASSAPASPAFDALWVHGYATANALHGIAAANALGIPVLLRAESWLADRDRSGPTLAAKAIFFRALESMVDAVLPIGTHNSRYWTHYFGSRVPQFPMPYAVDIDFFAHRSREAQGTRGTLLRALDLDPARPVILFASKLQPRKRCADLIEAYRLLLARGRLPQPPQLVIVGDGSDRPSLERQAADLPGVRFCGFRNQTELPRFFDLATVFVLPSQHEPWGLIVNEAMSAGRPAVVSTDVGCQLDLVRDGIEGAVFPTGDISGLTDALERVLATPETTAAMGRRAQERIRGWTFDEDLAGLREALAHVTHRRLSSSPEVPDTSLVSSNL